MVKNLCNRNQGKAINNFHTTLPEFHSDLSRDIYKDPYKFGFLTIEEKVNERMIKGKLIQKITDFLLELGKGFAFAWQPTTIGRSFIQDCSSYRR